MLPSRLPERVPANEGRPTGQAKGQHRWIRFSHLLPGVRRSVFTDRGFLPHCLSTDHGFVPALRHIVRATTWKDVFAELAAMGYLAETPDTTSDEEDVAAAETVADDALETPSHPEAGTGEESEHLMDLREHYQKVYSKLVRLAASPGSDLTPLESREDRSSPEKEEKEGSEQDFTLEIRRWDDFAGAWLSDDRRCGGEIQREAFSLGTLNASGLPYGLDERHWRSLLNTLVPCELTTLHTEAFIVAKCLHSITYMGWTQRRIRAGWDKVIAELRANVK